MNFGVSTLSRGPTATRAGFLAMAQAADRLGYGFVSVNDHVVVPGDVASKYPYSEDGTWAAADEGFCFEQLSLLSFLAACTTRVRLLTSVMVVPHRHPILAAKMLATADVLSEGRVTVGVGAGWMREEFDLLGAPYDARGAATDEYLRAFKALWTQPRPTFKGQFVDFENVLFAPKPVQKPHPPIWVGGESGPAMRRAATLGDGWYPGSSNPANRLDTVERLGAGIAKVRGLAQAAGRDGSALDVAYVVQWPVDWTAQMGGDGKRRFLTGSAADMAEDAATLGKLGVGHVALRLQTTSLTATLERIQRFGEEVIPLMGKKGSEKA
jgi:probable F420-dependent oxidoreductase